MTLTSWRVGLWGGISKLDREIYEEFSKDWEGLSTKAESIVGLPLFDLAEPVYNGDPHRKKSYAEIADKQARKFFRKSVISAYEGRCCITGQSIPQMVITSPRRRVFLSTVDSFKTTSCCSEVAK